MKTGYLRKTQFYIMIICFFVLGNGLLVHYGYEEILQDIHNQKLSHAYAHQLVTLEEAMAERSALYRQYIAHPKSRITLADLQLTEQKIKTMLAHLINASVGVIWEGPLKKLHELNQKFTGGATELVRASMVPTTSGKFKGLVLRENQKEDVQKFVAQIDEWDFALKAYIAKLRQIAGQADQLAAEDIHKQRQFFIFFNMMSCLAIVGLLVLIYVWISYRLRRSIVGLTHAMQDYSLFGARIPVLKRDQNSEMAHLIAAAQSFKEHVMESVVADLRESHPYLFKEVGQVIITSRDLKLTVNEILDAYDNRDLKTKDLVQSNEQTRNILRSIIKNGESFLATVRESEVLSNNKKIAPQLKNLESLIEQAHQAIIKEQNAAKRIVTMAKIESRQKRIFELLLELSVKMGYVAEQLEKELSLFIRVSPGSGEDVIIHRR